MTFRRRWTSIVRELAAGDLLFRQGDRAAAIYKIESGRLRLVRRTLDDHLVVLHTARQGDFLAEASLFAEVYHCDAVAAAPSRIRVYSKASVMEMFRSEPALAEAFMASGIYKRPFSGGHRTKVVERRKSEDRLGGAEAAQRKFPNRQKPPPAMSREFA